MTFSFFVNGVPAPQGSKKAFRLKTGKTALVESSKRVGSWRQDIAAVAQIGRPPDWAADYRGPVRVMLVFVSVRPRGHIGADGRVKKSAPLELTTRPDIDKLSRSVLDALTGILWADDAQVHTLTASKHYGDNPGVRVEVWT